jgi:hypothetical protein
LRILMKSRPLSPIRHMPGCSRTRTIA